MRHARHSPQYAGSVSPASELRKLVRILVRGMYNMAYGLVPDPTTSVKKKELEQGLALLDERGMYTGNRPKNLT